MSKTEKLFTVAGTARNSDGTVMARFANDLVARIKILNKAGCTDVNLVELPREMTKLEALQYLTEVGITEGDAAYAVANKLAEKAKVAKKGEVKVKAVKVPAKAKSTVTAEQLVEAAKA
jgi:ribosomal protein L15